MDLNLLVIFAEVYRAGGFAPVARAHNLAPSSVSRTIAALEADLETRLFQRTTRRLTPTEAGDALFRRVIPLIEQTEALRADLGRQAKEPSGRLRMTASVSYGQIAIVPRLKAFRALYPNIDLELILSDATIDLVTERIDLAIRHGTLPDSSMVARKLAPVRYRLVASPDYLKTAPALKSPYALAGHPCLTFSYDNFRSFWMFRRAEQSFRVEIKPAITVSNAAALAQCARDGLGVALLADWTVADDLAAGRLIQLLPHWEAAGATFDSALWLIFPSRQFIPAKARAFADFMTGEISPP